MSAYQQPYVPPPPPPRRKRPRKVWWFVAAGMIVLAPVIFVVSLFTVLSPLFHEDAVFSVSETPVQVSLPAGEERALFNDGFSPADCGAIDSDGTPVEFRPVTGDFTVNEWTAVYRFDSGNGDLTFECGGESPDSRIRIGELPSTGGFVTGILIGIIGPLLIGGTGVIMLIVVAVLYATGAPRNEPHQPAPGVPPAASS